MNLNPRVATHEPILNYETADKVDKELGFTGTEGTGIVPCCIIPFGLEEGLIKAVVVGKKIYEKEKLICAFGSETMSVEIKSEDLKKILKYCYENIYNI